MNNNNQCRDGTAVEFKLSIDATINGEKDSLLQHLINFADTGA